MDIKTREFGRTLSEKISEKGITKAELSRLVGVADTTITNYTKGRHKPRPYILEELGKVFNCSPDDLYKY